MDDLPKVYLTYEQHALEMAVWRDQETQRQSASRASSILHLELVRRSVEATELLAAPPSDKERLWQAVVAAMHGAYASEYDDLVIVSMAFDIAESAVLEFHKRVARLDAMGWRTEGGE